VRPVPPEIDRQRSIEEEKGKKKKKRKRRSTSRRPSGDSARGVAREPSRPTGFAREPQVRSATLDTWLPEQVAFIQSENFAVSSESVVATGRTQVGSPNSPALPPAIVNATTTMPSKVDHTTDLLNMLSVDGRSENGSDSSFVDDNAWVKFESSNLLIRKFLSCRLRALGSFASVNGETAAGGVNKPHASLPTSTYNNRSLSDYDFSSLTQGMFSKH
ncbi:hypothetical protein GW17_00022849, partial [Ensete ventricosum]